MSPARNQAYPPAMEPCPGCGHEAVRRALARAIEELGCAGRLIAVSTPGHGSLVVAGLGVDLAEAGREGAASLARGVKLARPDGLVLAYQEAGPLGGGGLAGLMSLARSGPGVSVVLVNNTVPPGQEAAPVDRLAILARAGRWSVLERVAVGSAEQKAQAGEAVSRVLAAQAAGEAPGLVEVLAPCPGAWEVSAGEARAWVSEGLTRLLPLGPGDRGHGSG